MLRGNALLQRVKELRSHSRAEMARRCGYVSHQPDGREHLQMRAFYEALLAAKGIQLGRHRDGRKLAFSTHVHFNGNLMVGKAYTELLQLEPGDRFEIKVEGQGFRLVPR